MNYKDASASERKAVAAGMDFRKHGRKCGKNYFCGFCGKDYKRKGTCENHVYSEHYGAIKADAERIKRHQDKRVNEYKMEVEAEGGLIIKATLSTSDIVRAIAKRLNRKGCNPDRSWEVRIWHSDGMPKEKKRFKIYKSAIAYAVVEVSTAT